jgi:hypothetical protein
VGKPEGRGPFGRYIPSWKDNIKVALKDIGWGEVNWMNVAQDMCKWETPLKIVMNNKFHKMR